MCMYVPFCGFIVYCSFFSCSEYKLKWASGNGGDGGNGGNNGSTCGKWRRQLSESLVVNRLHIVSFNERLFLSSS